MHALQVLADEHQSLAGIFHALHFALKEIAAGRLAPDMKWLQAVAHYLEAYPAQCHHPREEQLLFDRLRARCTDAEHRALLDALTAQHQQARALAGELVAAVAQYQQQLLGVVGLIAVLDRYADFYRELMLREEQQMLPLLHTYLSPQDWAEMDVALAAEAALPAVATVNAQFAALFSRLVAAAPEPVGLGLPYQD